MVEYMSPEQRDLELVRQASELMELLIRLLKGELALSGTATPEMDRGAPTGGFDFYLRIEEH